MKSHIAQMILSGLDEGELIQLAQTPDVMVKVLTLIVDKAEAEFLEIARDTNMGHQELLINAREREALDYLAGNVAILRNRIIQERDAMRTSASRLEIETNFTHTRK